jgi:hypothetical protein
MPPIPEIQHYFAGAWRLAKGDTGGMEHFDFSADGFWRSFWALVIVAPGYAILVADQYARGGQPVAFWPTFVAESLSYLLGWAAFPVVAIFLARFFDVAERYVPLIVALNWSSMVQMVAFLVPIAFGVLLSPAVVTFFLMLVSGAVLFYQGFIIKTALGCPVGIAVAFLAADLVAVMLVNGIVLGLIAG